MMTTLLLDRQRRKYFENIDQLQRWLLQQGINTMPWGKQQALTVQHLWAEMMRGETIILADPPLRVLHVAQVIVRQGEKVLIETEQELKRGGKRKRQRPPAEKMQPGETVFTASIRCLQEELGIEPKDIELRHDSYRHHAREGFASSYPGLPTRWLFHQIEAAVSGLPQEAFVTQESTENGYDPIQKHFWDWQPIASLDPT